MNKYCYFCKSKINYKYITYVTGFYIYERAREYSWVSLRHYAVNLRGLTSNVLMLMLYWSEKMMRNSTYLPPNTKLIHKTNNRLTLITVFCFRVEPPFVTSYETQEYWTLYLGVLMSIPRILVCICVRAHEYTGFYV
jgi:hypothetical protein